jgi:class 3 adenylate cyclase
MVFGLSSEVGEPARKSVQEVRPDSCTRVERRLAADLAGYSRMMGEDEEGTLARLMACRQACFDPKISEYRGRIVKTTGDGLLIDFSSAVEAVRCAIEIQQLVAESNSEVREERRLRFRIGIHVGVSLSMITTCSMSGGKCRPRLRR